MIWRRGARTGWPEAALFDMDGTVIDSEGACAAALAEFVSCVGGRAVPGPDQTTGVSTEAIVRLVLRQAGMRAEPELVRGGRAWLDRRIEQMLRRGVVFRPGAMSLVDDVRRAGVPTAIVTSSDRRSLTSC